MRIKVTKEDIAIGERSSCERCPIATALNRSLLSHANVGYDSIKIGNTDGTSYVSTTPQSARSFIAKFDNGKHVKPFSFEWSI